MSFPAARTFVRAHPFVTVLLVLATLYALLVLLTFPGYGTSGSGIGDIAPDNVVPQQSTTP